MHSHFLFVTQMIFPPSNVPFSTLVKRQGESVYAYVRRIFDFAYGYALAQGYQITEAYYSAFILHYLPSEPPFLPILRHFREPLILGNGEFNFEEYKHHEFVNVEYWLRDLEYIWERVKDLGPNGENGENLTEKEEYKRRSVQIALLEIDDTPGSREALTDYHSCMYFWESQLVFKDYLEGIYPSVQEELEDKESEEIEEESSEEGEGYIDPYADNEDVEEVEEMAVEETEIVEISENENEDTEEEDGEEKDDFEDEDFLPDAYIERKDRKDNVNF